MHKAFFDITILGYSKSNSISLEDNHKILFDSLDIYKI